MRYKIIFLLIIGLTAGIFGYLQNRPKPEQLPRPSMVNSHDPFQLGYPEDLEKHERVKKAEQIIVEEWDYIHGSSARKALKKTMDENDRNSKKMRQHYLSEEEREIYRKCFKSTLLLKQATQIQVREGKLTPREGKDIHQAYLHHVIREYLLKQKGIKVYSERSPGDRKILQEHGIIGK